MPRDLIESRIAWPRGRFWRPGEPLTITTDGVAVTYLLRGVMRDADPSSEWAVVTLEPVRAVDGAARIRRRSRAS
ncbi:MAG TPA: hypothetical protein VF367_04165 [Candidatus Limnocylindria bacterium]